jgi:hypothetical protein
VLVEQPAAIFLRHGVGRAEIHHVERAAGADIGHALADDGAEAVLGGREDAAHQQVADFRRGDVDDALHQAAVDQLLHRLAADAGGVEDEAVVLGLQRRGDLLDAGRGDAEHGEADARQLLGASARFRAASARALTMPAMACAPLASTARVIELRPCTSATECIIMMSDGPT